MRADTSEQKGCYIWAVLVWYRNSLIIDHLLRHETRFHLVRPTVSDRQSCVFPQEEPPTISVISSENIPPEKQVNIHMIFIRRDEI
jgi:hypothetical protein